MKVCAIHQPNFFPWLGYFDKIRRADVFVFLDQVDYPKSGSSMSSWCNRVKINSNGKAAWISCPVVREHGKQPIDSVRINNQRPWRDDLLKILEASYRKTTHFEEEFELIRSLIQNQTDSLADFNIQVIQRLSENFGYKPEWVRQSSLPSMSETATARLVTICQTLGADIYLCGGGSDEYLGESAFNEAGVKLLYQNFQPMAYGSPEAFLPGLSVIDWLMHHKG